MDLINVTLGAIENPVIYSIIFLIYVILAVIILPIPVEIGLFNPYIHPILLVSVLALGKGIGACIVFEVGVHIRDFLKKWASGTALTHKIIGYCESFVKKYGYIGLFIIMSTPLMVDSVSLYLFSLLNPRTTENKRALDHRRFVVINIAAGAVRGSVILIAYHVGIRLV